MCFKHRIGVTVQPRRIDRLRYRVWAAPRARREVDAAVMLHGTLRSIGWTESANKRAPVDGHGEPIPWYTYGALVWLEHALSGGESVFEYGGGHSSLWYGKKTMRVVTVEHDREWAALIQDRSPSNVSLLYRFCDGSDVAAPDGDAYVTAIDDFPEPWDVIAVDGMARNSCVSKAIERLAADGLVVLDNSDRLAYRPAVKTLHQAGFTRLDFSGWAPGGTAMGCTSVFSRNLARWVGEDVHAPQWPTMTATAPRRWDLRGIAKAADAK